MRPHVCTPWPLTVFATCRVVSLARLGLMPNPEEWAIYVDCIEALSGSLDGAYSAPPLSSKGENKF